MKCFIGSLAIITILLVSGCTALETVATNNKDKIVTINAETWGGKLVAEMVSVGSSVLPNVTICFGKTNTYYNATPATSNPELVKALAEHIKNSNSAVSATASGFEQKK
jgi:hypothetical protein